MKARELARRLRERLASGGVEDAAFEAEYLVRSAASLSRGAYFADPRLTDEQVLLATGSAERRLAREPAAYITGEREFFGLCLGVSRHVLVPRPETEILVEVALEEAENYEAPTILDVGTGSGAIAVATAYALKGRMPRARILGVDVSPQAVAVARSNAARNGVEVEFLIGDLAAPVAAADVVLANLPYIPAAEIDELEPEVSVWEPRVALDGGADGFALIRRLVADCASRLRPGLLALEIGFGMAPTALALVSAMDGSPSVIKDLAGIDRVVVARWA